MALRHRLSNLIRGRHLDPEIDEELLFHLDSRIRDNIAAGMPPDEARRDALRRFGNRVSLREETRDTEIVVALETMAQDLRFAARSLVRRPGFAAIALLTLALGIGANTAIFTIVHSVLLRPLPYDEPEALHYVAYGPARSPFWLLPGLSDSDYLAFREHDRSFEALATFASAPLTLTGDGDAARVASAMVTPDFFRVLRIPAAAGRTFLADDVRKGAEPAVVVSHGLWRDRFGGDPGLVSRRIVLDGVPRTVVGILPTAFSYPAGIDVWTPFDVQRDPHTSFTRPVIGRLATGVTRTQAQAALEALVQHTREGGAEAGAIAQVRPLKDGMVGDAEASLLVFSGAVGLVLLIACANVVNLLLMRAVARRHEIATRLALGASRLRLIRLLVTEGALLSACGGALGIALAWLGGPALLALIPAGKLPRAAEIYMDGWVLAFTLGLIVVTTLVVGVIPALHAGRDDLSAVARETSASSTRGAHRLRHALVVAEVALALVLLVGAGLLARSFLKISSVNPGFQPAQAMTLTVDVPPARYRDAPALHEFHRRVIESLEHMPGVQSAGAVNWLPLGDMHLQGDISVEGRSVPDDYNVIKSAVSPRYFAALGIALQGGGFTDGDVAGAPGVAIVSESLARRVWPDGNVLGQRISIETKPKPADWLTIVGIAGDIRQGGLTQAIAPVMYQSYRQVARPAFLRHMTFIVRTDANPREMAPLMRAALRAVDPDQAPQRLATMDSVLAQTIAEPRFQTQLVGAFSILALLLAAIGVYGVLAASVAERHREIGIRMALGADHAAVVRMVLRRSLLLTGSGIVLGLCGAAVLTKGLTGLLVEVTSTDPGAFVAATVIVFAAALLAALIPARKATQVDPLVALRTS
jgi:putative ABC transport system permease protein